MLDPIKVNPRQVLSYSFAQRFIMGLTVGLVGPLVPFIARNLNVGLDRIGVAISFSVIAIFAVSLILNNFIDVLGYKIVLLSGLIMVSAGCLGIFLSGAYWFFVLSLVFYQMGNGILSITIFSIIGELRFEKKSLRILQTTIFYTLGNIFVLLIVSLFTAFKMSWQYIFLGFAVIQLMLGFFLIRLKIPKENKLNKKSGNLIKNLLKIDIKIISNSFFIIIVVMALLYSAVIDTFFTWFTSYFESLNVEVSRSSLFLVVYTISLLAGLIIKSQIQKRMEERKLLLWGIFLSFVFMILIFFIGNLVIKNIILFFYGICITGNFSFLIIISMGLGPQHSASIVTYIHAAAYLGSIVFQYLSGFTTEHFSKNSVFYINISLLLIIFILAIIVNRKSIKLA